MSPADSRVVLHRPFQVYGWFVLLAGAFIAIVTPLENMAWGYLVFGIGSALLGAILLVLDHQMHVTPTDWIVTHTVRDEDDADLEDWFRRYGDKV